MTKTQYSRLLVLLAVCLAAGASLVNAQAPRKNACSNSKRAKFTIECKDRYYVGETATITLSNNNTTRTLMTVKEFEHQKFTLEVTGVFSNYRVVEKKTIDYRGKFYIPPATDTDRLNLWYAPVLLPAKYVTLRPGESTSMQFNLSQSSKLGAGRYKVVFKSADGQEVAKEFEVYFDNEKSLPLMVKQLESVEDRNWAFANLLEFNRPALVTSLKALAANGDEKQRQFAISKLGDIESGNFNPLKLVLVTQSRYSRNADPTVTISIRNGSQSPEPAKAAEQEKFFLELRKLAHPGKRDEHYEDTKQCVYTPKDAQQDSKFVTLGPNESTSVNVSLQQCFGAHLEAGHYHLVVKRNPEEQRDWKIDERRFEIR